MMYCVMSHRMQVTLEEDQYRWLKREAQRNGGSIAAVMRRLVDDARSKPKDPYEDPFVKYLLSEPVKGERPAKVSSLDEEIYGHCERSS